jgi:serine/threonine protein kinase
MTVSARCPDRAALEQLLKGELPAERQSVLTGHVEDCSTCQDVLATLSAEQALDPALAGRLATGRRPQPEEALRRAIHQLQGGPHESEGPVESTESDGDLAFLQPPRGPGHLGRLGHYEVLGVIGRGGMGVVLKAFDDTLHRMVAIKVLAPQLATSVTARKRFIREAQAAAAVRDEHVVSIYAVEETAGLPYLVMELIAGISLQERLDRTGPLKVQEILRIGMQTAAGLAAAHGQGVIHRDIKPANILLENGVERVKITDFGLARSVDDDRLTQSGVVAGTPQYMSPEQANGQPVDARADLFSLGSVLYALCTGRPPFQADSPLATLKCVCEYTPLPIPSINPSIPLWLVAIIARLHSKNPAERFATASEVAGLLGQRLGHLHQHGSLPLTDDITWTEAARPSSVPGPRPAGRRYRVLAVALFALAVVLTLTELAGITPVWATLRGFFSTATPQALTPSREPAVPVNLPPITTRAQHRQLADSLSREGDHTTLAELAKRLPQSFPDSCEDWHWAAFYLTRCEALARADLRLAQEYEKQARDILQKAARHPEAAVKQDVWEAACLPVVAAKNCKLELQWMKLWGAKNWSNGWQLQGEPEPGNPGGSSFELEIEVARKGAYQLEIYFTRGPNYGIVEVALDDQVVGELFNGYSETVTPTREITFGTLELDTGSHRVRFTLVGKDPNVRTPRAMIGIDCLELVSQNAVQLLKAGDHAAAAEAAEQLARDAPKSWSKCHYAAMYLIQCVGVVEKDSRLSAEERQVQARGYVNRARVLLAESARRGAPSIKGAIEAETLPIADSKDCWPIPQNMAPWGWRRWSNSYQLFCPAEKDGHVTLEFEVARQGRYQLDVYFTRSPAFGLVEIALDGRKVGTPFDACAAEVGPSGAVPLGVLELSQGKHHLRFTALDRSPQTNTCGFGIDCLKLEPVK